MKDGARQKADADQDWQKADARILGQILSAQNIVFTLPNTLRIAEFYAQILMTIPGIIACRVCLGGTSVLAGEMAGDVCAQCKTRNHLVCENGALPPAAHRFKCNLADQPGMRVMAVDSYQHQFGFFVLMVYPAEVNHLYQPFIGNLSSFVALILENRWQKDLLQKAHDELELKVAERTQALTAANEALNASRRDALAKMAEAIQVRQRAEHASAELQREVAEHKRVQREYLTLLESVPDFIVRYDLDLRRKYVNPAWERTSGLSAGEVIDVPYTDLPKVPNPVNDEYVRKLRLAQNTGVSQTAELTWVNARGETLFLEYVIVPEYDHHGKVAGVLAVGRDISERKRAEEVLARYRNHLEKRVRQRTAELEAANKELEAFAYSVSHDLRAPLRHIDGFLELLHQNVGKTLNDQGRHYIDNIFDAAQKMGQLIDDLLSFSRTGRQEISLQQVALRPLVQDIIQGLEPDAAGRNIDWYIGDLPVVSGDGAMLRTVLINLISNALKFTRPQEKARIEIGVLPGHATEAVIYVRDNGVGFDMAYADKLFGVFQRLHHVDEFEGTGIGLANVRRIITRNGGRIWAEGKVRQGATFYISLPHIPRGNENERS